MRRLFISFWLVIIALNALVIVFAFLALRRDRVPVIRYEIASQLGPAITNIVDRIILDVGLLEAKKEAKEADKKQSGQADSPPPITLVPADVSGLDFSSGWVNGRRFEVGQVIVPFGMVLVFKSDSAILQDLNDPTKLTVLASGLPVAPSPVVADEKKKPDSPKSDSEKSTGATVVNKS